MPTYDYDCTQCGGFDAFRTVSMRNEDAICPDCGRAASRVFVSAPRLALMSADARNAMVVNERAQHEPRQSGHYARLRHPSGCGCCATAKRGATLTSANGDKSFPKKRPWMISH